MSYRMRFTERSIPKDVIEEINAPAHNQAVAYIYPGHGERVVAKGYQGKRLKPDWNYSFKDLAAAQDYIKRWLEGVERSVNYRAKQKQERAIAKQIGHGLEVGDILVSSWGYEQTNIDFYQVIESGPKSVVIQEIGYASKEGTGCFEQYNVMPEPGKFIGKPMRKFPSAGGGYYGTSVNIASYASAHKWDGKPQRMSSYA